MFARNVKPYDTHGSINYRRKYSFLYFTVSGCLFTSVTTEIFVQPLNRDIAFLREKDVLSSDVWHVIIELNLDPYFEAILTMRRDLVEMETHKQEFIPVAELKVVEALLQTPV
jgi:hypothetical protein